MASTHHHLYQFFQFIDLLVNTKPLKNGEGDWIKTLENKLQQQHHLHSWVLSDRERYEIQKKTNKALRAEKERDQGEVDSFIRSRSR